MQFDQLQRFLTFRFDARPFEVVFREKLNLKSSGGAICLDIATAQKWTRYSRRKAYYSSIPLRYRVPSFTYAGIVHQVDHLDKLGLIEHAKRPSGSIGWQSSIKATPELVQIVDAILGNQVPKFRAPRELICLNTEKPKPGRKILIDYTDTSYTKRAHKRVLAQNEAISTLNLCPKIGGLVFRVFNEDFRHGGRHHVSGGGYQLMNAAQRGKLILNDEPVVEVDFKSLHPSLLYAEHGCSVPVDCYDISGWPRGIAKKGLLIVINARSEISAVRALAQSTEMREFVVGGDDTAFAAAHRVIDDLKQKHRPIADSFHSNAGVRLMFLDSQIAEEVMSLMRRKSVAVLPVHDSFIAVQSAEGELKEAMAQASECIVGISLKVETK